MIAAPRSLRTALTGSCLLVAPLAGAQADAIALSCPVCHGAPAASAAQAPSAVPPFYGRPVGEIEASLREFRAGTRAGSAMPRLSHSLTDAEIEALARRYGGRN